jgi:glutathione S-transferase/GST-like protein
MLELYHGEPNTFSLKPLIVLHEKGLDYTGHYAGPTDFDAIPAQVRAALEVQHNPEGDGPILADRGVAMTESFFISLHLDEAFPQAPLRAPDAANRWRVLMWARFVNEVLAPSVVTLGCHKHLSPWLKTQNRAEIEPAIAAMPTPERRHGWKTALDGAYSADVIEDSRRKIAIGVKKVEGALASGDWLAGPAYSLADIDAFALLAPVSGLAPDLLDEKIAPRTTAWLARILRRPAVAAAFARSKTGKPLESFVPGPEHSRWG